MTSFSVFDQDTLKVAHAPVLGVDIISRVQPQNASSCTDGRRGAVVISHPIRSAVSHNDPWDIVTFGERHSRTAAFLTFHQSLCDSACEEARCYPLMKL